MNTGQIIRSKSTDRFTMIPNEVLRSNKLSAKAKGVLVTLLSLPPDWVVNKSQLPDLFLDGYTSINSAFTELETAGFILSARVLNEKGQFAGWNYIVYDTPATSENPITENLKSGFSESENLQLLNTDYTNTDYTKNTRSNARDFENSLKTKEENPPVARAPLFSDVERVFIQQGGTKEMAEAFFNRYEATGWKIRGTDVLNFAKLVGNFIVNWKQNTNGERFNNAGVKLGTSEARQAAFKNWGFNDDGSPRIAGST